MSFMTCASAFKFSLKTYDSYCTKSTFLAYKSTLINLKNTVIVLKTQSNIENFCKVMQWIEQVTIVICYINSRVSTPEDRRYISRGLITVLCFIFLNKKKKKKKKKNIHIYHNKQNLSCKRSNIGLVMV